jgi:hypothetical protein
MAPIETTAIKIPEIKANGVDIPIINSPINGILPISPKRNIKKPMKMIMLAGSRGVMKKFENFFEL